MPEIKLKRFVVIPHDAMELLPDRYVSIEEAVQSAQTRCEETGARTVVVEMKAVAARADRPVKVTKL